MLESEYVTLLCLVCGQHSTGTHTHIQAAPRQLSLYREIFLPWAQLLVTVCCSMVDTGHGRGVVTVSHLYAHHMLYYNANDLHNGQSILCSYIWPLPCHTLTHSFHSRKIFWTWEYHFIWTMLSVLLWFYIMAIISWGQMLWCWLDADMSPHRQHSRTPSQGSRSINEFPAQLNLNSSNVILLSPSKSVVVIQSSISVIPSLSLRSLHPFRAS